MIQNLLRRRSEKHSIKRNTTTTTTITTTTTTTTTVTCTHLTHNRTPPSRRWVRTLQSAAALAPRTAARSGWAARKWANVRVARRTSRTWRRERKRGVEWSERRRRHLIEETNEEWGGKVSVEGDSEWRSTWGKEGLGLSEKKWVVTENWWCNILWPLSFYLFIFQFISVYWK